MLQKKSPVNIILGSQPPSTTIFTPLAKPMILNDVLTNFAEVAADKKAAFLLRINVIKTTAALKALKKKWTPEILLKHWEAAYFQVFVMGWGWFRTFLL